MLAVLNFVLLRNVKYHLCKGDWEIGVYNHIGQSYEKEIIRRIYYQDVIHAYNDHNIIIIPSNSTKLKM